MIRAVVSLLLAGAAGASTAAAGPAPSKDGYGAALSCPAKPQKVFDLLAQEARRQPSDSQWIEENLTRVGYPAKVPSAAPAQDAALAAAALLRDGHILAAKMMRDEANKVVPGFSATPFSGSLEALLTILAQPVPHASYPTNVRADGEKRDEHAKGAHTHGTDLEQTSGSLGEIVGRAEVAKRAMGDAYSKPSVRFYLLAHGFRDQVALRAATAAVCGEKLDSATVGKLNISARYMAMPSAYAVEGEAK